MKKILIIFLILINIVACKDNSLPIAENDADSDFNVDININMNTIDKYLNRQDFVYRDVRMLIDEANFEAIGGDSYLSGFIKGFEVVPYPYLCDSNDLPVEVGGSYKGDTLFSYSHNEYKANYVESLDILKSLFPQDKNIILMCGAGGYAMQCKDMLVSLGWDEDKIYNAGGYWYYEGDNKVEVKYSIDNIDYYNLALVNYHNIDFSTLHLIDDDNQKDISIFNQINDVDELNEYVNNNDVLALYVYLTGCSTCAKYTPLIKDFVLDNDINMYAVNLEKIFKSTNSVTDLISVSPAILLYKEGKVISYLDHHSIEDIKTSLDLESWFLNYIDLSLLKNCDSCTVN